MKLTRLASVATAMTLTVALAACGSAEKTADQQASTGADNAGALIGVTMPTRSSGENSGCLPGFTATTTHRRSNRRVLRSMTD